METIRSFSFILVLFFSHSILQFSNEIIHKDCCLQFFLSYSLLSSLWQKHNFAFLAFSSDDKSERINLTWNMSRGDNTFCMYGYKELCHMLTLSSICEQYQRKNRFFFSNFCRTSRISPNENRDANERRHGIVVQFPFDRIDWLNSIFICVAQSENIELIVQTHNSIWFSKK